MTQAERTPKTMCLFSYFKSPQNIWPP